MKKILSILLISITLTGCGDWLDVRPKDLQYTADFWKSKEDVDAILASAYYDMRILSENLFIWSELRGSSVNSQNRDNIYLQNFQLSSDKKLCQWGGIYNILNLANSVIKYAPDVYEIDETYTLSAMQSHQAEAYFIRSLMNFYLVRIWCEAPLVTEPYIDDSMPFAIAKSSEAVIIEQIKTDIRAALATGSAKEHYDNERWEASKGRATKWALYALMADVCLWSEDYDECIVYSDLLINADATWRPVFMTNPIQWFEMFDPGNSNESIFEINWSYTMGNQVKGSPYDFVKMNDIKYHFSASMTQRLMNEDYTLNVLQREAVRSRYGAASHLNFVFGERMCCTIYKYQGNGITKGIIRDVASANYIIYRMADVMLMKAEALSWKGGADNWQQAIDILNQIRVRVNLLEYSTPDFDQMTELDMLQVVLYERDMELAAEGKRWYDLLRFGKSKNFKYRSEFIDIIVENNESANSTWLRSTLRNNWAWYLPVSMGELEVNNLLVQNPYYK